jgi:hypothetical protein
MCYFRRRRRDASSSSGDRYRFFHDPLELDRELGGVVSIG